jgi:hypothetical protein
MAELVDFARFYKLVGASETCDVCGKDWWVQLSPVPPDDYEWPEKMKKPDFLYIGSQAKDGGPNDILTFPVAAIACQNCGNVRQHLLSIVENILKKDVDENG